MTLLQFAGKKSKQESIRTIDINASTFTQHNCRPVVVLDDYLVLSCLNNFYILDKNSYEVLQIIPETLAAETNPELWALSVTTALSGNRFAFRIHGGAAIKIYTVNNSSYVLNSFSFTPPLWAGHDFYDNGNLFVASTCYTSTSRERSLIMNVSNDIGRVTNSIANILGGAVTKGENTCHKGFMFTCSDNGTGGGESYGRMYRISLPLSTGIGSVQTIYSTNSKDIIVSLLDCGDQLHATFTVNKSAAAMKVFSSFDAGVTWNINTNIPPFIGGVRFGEKTIGLFNIAGESYSSLRVSNDGFTTVEKILNLGIKLPYGPIDFCTSPALNGKDILLYDKGILYIINI